MKLYLPRKKNICQVNREDPVFWCYFPLIGYVYKKRLFNTLSLLGKNYSRLLDIGYGSGVLFPELSLRAKQVFGLEIHGKEKLIRHMLEKEKISNVILKKGSVYEIPFENNYFSCVVSVSVLEHLDDLDKAMLEVKRVLEKGGEAIFSFPIRNLLTDSFFWLAGYNPKRIHPSTHIDILNKAKKYFSIENTLKFPNFSNINFSLYRSIKCVKHD